MAKPKKLTQKQKVARMRTVLIRACNKHLKAGGKIISGAFEGTNNSYCPIGCAAGDWGSRAGDYLKRFSTALGMPLTEKDMWDFIGGFDADEDEVLTNSQPKTLAYRLGLELRKKYLKGD